MQRLTLLRTHQIRYIFPLLTTAIMSMLLPAVAYADATAVAGTMLYSTTCNPADSKATANVANIQTINLLGGWSSPRGQDAITTPATSQPYQVVFTRSTGANTQNLPLETWVVQLRYDAGCKVAKGADNGSGMYWARIICINQGGITDSTQNLNPGGDGTTCSDTEKLISYSVYLLDVSPAANQSPVTTAIQPDAFVPPAANTDIGEYPLLQFKNASIISMEWGNAMQTPETTPDATTGVGLHEDQVTLAFQTKQPYTPVDSSGKAVTPAPATLPAVPPQSQLEVCAAVRPAGTAGNAQDATAYAACALGASASGKQGG